MKNSKKRVPVEIGGALRSFSSSRRCQSQNLAVMAFWTEDDAPAPSRRLSVPGCVGRHSAGVDAQPISFRPSDRGSCEMPAKYLTPPVS